MKLKFLSIFLLLLFGISVYAQDRFDSPVGFSIDRPRKWASVEKLQLDKSVEMLALSPEKIEKILQSGKNSVLVLAFTKYSPEKVSGPIPTVQVRLRKNPIDNFEEFKSAFIRSLSPARSPFEAYEFVGEPVQIEISGLTGIFIRSKYVLSGADGMTAEVRARTYAIPDGGHYFQITMIDFPKSEDCSAEFDDLIKTIGIIRNIDTRPK